MNATSAFAAVGLAVVGFYTALYSYWILRWFAHALYYCTLGPAALAGKKVIVFGASSGIGLGTAQAFAKKGAHVTFCGRRKELLEQVAAATEAECRRLGSPGRCATRAVDCTKPEELQQMAREYLHKVDVPDIIVTCAAFGKWGYLVEQTHQDIDAGLRAPLATSAHCIRAFLPSMLAVEGARHVIVPMSPVAFFTWPGATMYTANRWGLRGLTHALQQDCHGTHIKVMLATCTPPRCAPRIPAAASQTGHHPSATTLSRAVGEAETGYWDANPGSRQYVPWISRTGLIPTLSSGWAGERIVRQVCVRGGDFVENFQIQALLDMMRVTGLDAAVLWIMRWFRSALPGVGIGKSRALV